MVRGAHLWLLATVCAGAVIVDDFPLSGLENQLKIFVYNNNGLGSYSFEYETPDGTFRREQGGLDPDTENLVVRGEYGYTDPDGNRHYARYIADDLGFQLQMHDDDTSEDVELRRVFPNEFPQDTVRRSGALEPEHLGRYEELSHYFNFPKNKLNNHFEELACYDNGRKKTCKIDLNRYSPEEDSYYKSIDTESHVDRRRVYCLMLLCFTEDELDRVVASF